MSSFLGKKIGRQKEVSFGPLSLKKKAEKFAILTDGTSRKQFSVDNSQQRRMFKMGSHVGPSVAAEKGKSLVTP